METNQLKEVKTNNKNKCKGLYWRAQVSSFLSTHNSIETRKSLRLLKRKSCSGCEHCGWFWDYIKEDICIEICDYIGDVEDGKVYTFKVHSSQGYYDLHPEIDEIEFVKVKN